MIYTWYNLRSGYIIKYTYDDKLNKLSISRNKFNGIKTIPHYY